MKRTKEDYLRVLNETLGYYTEDVTRRGIKIDEDGDPRCTYYSPEGKMCAVGRCLAEPKKFEKVVNTASRIIKDHSDTIFKEEYRGFDPIFWQDLQDFHDGKNFWLTAGLSHQGKTRVDMLLKRVEEGHYLISQE